MLAGGLCEKTSDRAYSESEIPKRSEYVKLKINGLPRDHSAGGRRCKQIIWYCQYQTPLAWRLSELTLAKLLTVEDIQVETANMETLGQKSQGYWQNQVYCEKNYFG